MLGIENFSQTIHSEFSIHWCERHENEDIPPYSLVALVGSHLSLVYSIMPWTIDLTIIGNLLIETMLLSLRKCV